MITVYIIKSQIKNWLYVGQTNDIARRLKEHNHGLNKSTKAYAPFKLVYTESFENRLDARKAEKYYKSAAGKRKLYKLLLEGHEPV
jgi:putative endonuclease